ncbi:MAG: two-component regulator propeller domain-containing protein, partial [Chitinophagaceae bacterium]
MILFLQVALAQRNEFNFINFSSKNGLSSNTVNVILKDRYGYMWFATEDGLNKFDGVNFTVYRNNPGDTTSIGTGAVLAMQEDRSGTIWVGCGRRLSRYNREKDNFTNYDFTEKGSIRSISIDHSGKVWVGTYSGLYVLDTRNGNFKTYNSDPGNVDQLMSNAIITVFEDSRNRIWVGTIDGLHLYLQNSNSFKRFLHSDADPFSLSDKIVRTIAEDFNGNIWVGTDNGGLNSLQPDGKTFKHYNHSAEDINTISNDRVFDIKVDNSGQLWIATDEGLNIFEPQTAKVTRVMRDRRNNYSLNGKSVRNIFIDKDGIYWVSTFQAGVNKYDKNLAFFNLRQSNPFDPLGLNAAIITSFAETPSGDIYVGTDGGGLNLYHTKTGLFDHPALNPVHSDKTQSILALERIENELWIGTYLDGLYILNMITGAIRHYKQGDGPKDLSDNAIFCIKKDSRGNVWVGNNGNGLDRYDPKSGTFQRFNPINKGYGNHKLPINGFIRALEEDRFGNIWIGSNGSGIAVFDPWDQTFKVLNRANSNLPLDNVLSMHVDNDGNIWAGVSGGGLCLYDYNTKKFTSYSEQDGLSNGMIYKILEDDFSKLWISTNKGVSSFDIKNKKFKNYSHYNGLQQSTYSMGAGLKTSTGEMFFGGLDGFNYFNPRELHSNKNVPSLVITNLKISNRSVVPGEDEVIKEHISVAKEIRLSHRQNFSLDYIALNYTAPQESQYSYKLEGFDKDWNNVGYSKTAVYTNLDPGKYTFRLKASSDDGFWTTPETTITIYVSPPFWRTPYAYAFYFLAAVLVLWGLRYRAHRKFKNKFALEQERLQVKQMIEQERKEAERKHEFDQIKIKFLTNLSHEFRTPISLIVGPTDKLMQQEASEKKREQLGMIKRNANRLLNLVNQLLDFRKLEEHELKLDLTGGDLVSFVRDVSDSFKD